MVVRRLDHGGAQADLAGAGTYPGQIRQRRRQATVDSEKVLGEPEGVKSESIREDRLLFDVTIKLGDILFGRDVEVIEEGEAHRRPFSCRPRTGQAESESIQTGLVYATALLTQQFPGWTGRDRFPA